VTMFVSAVRAAAIKRRNAEVAIMPDYTYACPACRATTDRRESMTADDPVPCPECGTLMHRRITAASVIWKGGSPSSGKAEEWKGHEMTNQKFLRGRGWKGEPGDQRRRVYGGIGE